MGKVTVVGGKVGMEAPGKGIALSTIAEGSIVKINENGSPVEFYVAMHNYESTLNGSGRTLLVRKECHSSRVWDSGNVNAFVGSDIDLWLNGDYKSLFDEKVQSAVGMTTFYYTVGGGNTTKTTLQRSVFLLSAFELGFRSSMNNAEGSTSLPTALILTGLTVDCYTRTPVVRGSVASTSDVVYISASDGNAIRVNANTAKYIRPCFTLPATAIFNEKTLVLKGVA